MDENKEIKTFTGDVEITVNIRHDGDRQEDRNTVTAPRPSDVLPKRSPKRRNWRAVYIVVMCFCVLGIISSFWSDSAFTPSTRERTALPPRAAAETGFYTDDAGWIDDERDLIRGLERFYDNTGVAPYVYITGSAAADISADRLGDFADALYRELFFDEAHLLLVFLPSDDGFAYSFAAGTQAASVVDGEAESIIHDYLEMYYTYNYTNSEKLGDAFDSAARRMMRVTAPPFTVLVVCGAGAALATFLFIRWRKKQREAEDDLTTQEVEQLLSIPLEKFGDPEVEELVKKYED